MATYRPGIDQSQHMKSVSHIIKYNTIQYGRIEALFIQVSKSVKYCSQ